MIMNSSPSSSVLASLGNSSRNFHSSTYRINHNPSNIGPSYATSAASSSSSSFYSPSSRQINSHPTNQQSCATKTTFPTRPRDFSEHENLAICRAWISTSEDAIHSTDQKKVNFWHNVHNDYKSLIDDLNNGLISKTTKIFIDTFKHENRREPSHNEISANCTVELYTAILNLFSKNGASPL